MFESKYLFESKLTQFKRRFWNLIAVLLILSVTIFAIIFYIPFSSRQDTTSTQKLYATSNSKEPDIIAVFTGDIGRIDFALKYFKKFQNTRLLISGVYGPNTARLLLHDEKLAFLKNNIEQAIKISIDHESRNTFENVLTTFHYARTNQLRKLVIISSDYHIFRIKIIAKHLLLPEDKFNISYIGVKTNWFERKNFWILVKEFFKNIKTYIFLKLWDEHNIELKET